MLVRFLALRSVCRFTLTISLLVEVQYRYSNRARNWNSYRLSRVFQTYLLFFLHYLSRRFINIFFFFQVVLGSILKEILINLLSELMVLFQSMKHILGIVCPTELMAIVPKSLLQERSAFYKPGFQWLSLFVLFA